MIIRKGTLRFPLLLLVGVPPLDLIRFGDSCGVSELFVVYDFPLIDLSFLSDFLFSTASASAAAVADDIFHSFRLPLAGGTRLLLVVVGGGGCRSSSFLQIFP